MKSVLDLIGNTPMVKLNNLTKDLEANILVKLEYLNPSGSMKDRIALKMIEMAEEEGTLRPGYKIVESSTGNTGTSLSFVGTMKGYRVIIYETIPGRMGEEKVKIIVNTPQGKKTEYVDVPSHVGEGTRLFRYLGRLHERKLREYQGARMVKISYKGLVRETRAQ